MSAIQALSMSDLKHVNRDTWLKFLLIYPILLGLAMRFGVPWVTTSLGDRFNFDFTQYHVLLVSFFGILVVPLLVGDMVGLLLLDEKDFKTLVALQVTPLSMGKYAFYRVVGPMLICGLGIYVVIPLMGNIVPTPYLGLLPLAFLSALEAPMFALILASLARNKVEGLALMKASGVLMLGPFAAWFTPLPWQWLLGIFPTFWPVKAYWLLMAGQNFWPTLLIGVLYHGLLLYGLVALFQRRAALAA